MKLVVLKSILAVMAMSIASYSFAKQVVEPIHFKKGTNGSTIKGMIYPNDRAIYTFTARQGQLLTAKITSKNDNAVIVYSPNIQQIAPSAPKDVINTPISQTGSNQVIAVECLGSSKCVYQLSMSIL